MKRYALFVCCAVIACTGPKKASRGVASPAPAAGPSGPSSPAAPQESAATSYKTLVDQLRAERDAGQVDWASAEARMRAFTSRHPNHGLGWYNLGVAQERQDKLADAETSYRRAVHEDPKLSRAQENLASLVLRQGDRRQAVSLLRDLVARDPSASSARVALAESHLANGDSEEAVRLAREALARDPKSIPSYCVMAKAAVDAKDYLRARLVVSQGLKIEQGSPAACLYHALGRVYLAEGETAKALVEFQRVVEKDGGTILEARFHIAGISLGFKDFKRAIDTYQSIAAIDPGNVAAYINVGVAYKGSGQYELAEKAYLQAIAVAKDEPSPIAHFNLGVLYLKNLDRIVDAKTQLKRYLEIGSPRSDDRAFAWLEEIEQRRAMEAEMKRMDEESKRDAELERKAAEAEAKRKADEAKKAAESGEPSAPVAAQPDPKG